MRNRLVFLLLIMLTGLAVLAVRAIEEIALVQPSTLGIALMVQIVLQAELLAIIPFEPEGLAGHLDPVLHAVEPQQHVAQPHPHTHRLVGQLVEEPTVHIHHIHELIERRGIVAEPPSAVHTTSKKIQQKLLLCLGIIFYFSK